ncbi:MAG: ABC transporter substrate-binding protein [Chthonomonadales bacterium]
MRNRIMGLFAISAITTFTLAGCKDTPASNAPVTGNGTNAVSTSSRPVAAENGNPVTGNEILVGEYASLTGDTATFGKGTHNGIQMAIDEANDAGGISGKKIRLLTEDDASKPEQAQTVVTKLCADDKVAVVLGEVASTRSIRGASICQKYGVPMISPSSTNPEVTKGGDCIFRVCFTDDFQAAVAAHYAWDAGWKTAAIFKDIKSDYAKGFAENFSAEYTKLGGKITGEQSYQGSDTDFKAQLNTLKGQDPSCVMVPGYYSEMGTIARQAKEIGLKVPLLGGDGWDSPQLIPGAGTALEDCVFTDHYFSTELKDKGIEDFVAGFTKKYGAAPDALAALGYDAAKLMIDALKRAKTLDGKGIRAAIAETKDFAGVSGTITIDANGNARKSALVMQIKGKDFKVIKSYTPEQIGK